MTGGYSQDRCRMRTAQEPVNSALPFSTKDDIPIDRSSVAKSAANARRSIVEPGHQVGLEPGRWPPSPPAGPGPDRAPALAPAPAPPLYTSAVGTTRLASPIASASSASTCRPVKISSLARDDPDQPRQALGAARAGDDAEQDLRLAQLGVVADDPQVAAQRQLAAAAQRVAGDGGDGGLRDARHGGEGVLEADGGPDHVLVGHPGHLLDVGAGREDLRAAVDDHGTDVGARADLLGRGA